MLVERNQAFQISDEFGQSYQGGLIQENNCIKELVPEVGDIIQWI